MTAQTIEDALAVGPPKESVLFSNRDKFDLVEILTWNDFGESHYIAPVKGDQPNSQAWVDGNPHDGLSLFELNFIISRSDHQYNTGFLDMTNYYATAFKTGKYPEITQDAIYVWARPTSTDATSGDPVGKPTNFDTVSVFISISRTT